MSVIVKVQLAKPCKLWTGFRNPKGYGRTKHKDKNVLVHRMAYCEHHGLKIEDIDGIVIRHKCDNPACIEPTHLQPGTVADNNRDKILRGRAVNPPKVRGEAHSQARLSENQVREVKRLLALGLKSTKISEYLGVSRGCIRGIQTGANWKHIS